MERWFDRGVLGFGAAGAAAFLNSEGVMLVCFLKTALKDDFELKQPPRNAQDG